MRSYFLLIILSISLLFLIIHAAIFSRVDMNPTEAEVIRVKEKATYDGDRIHTPTIGIRKDGTKYFSGIITYDLTMISEKYGFDELSVEAKSIVFSQLMKLCLFPAKDASEFNIGRRTDEDDEAIKNILDYRAGLLTGWCYVLEIFDFEKLEEKLNEWMKKYPGGEEGFDIAMVPAKISGIFYGADVSPDQERYQFGYAYPPITSSFFYGFLHGRDMMKKLITNLVEEIKLAIQAERRLHSEVQADLVYDRNKFLSETPTVEAFLFIQRAFLDKMKEDRARTDALVEYMQIIKEGKWPQEYLRELERKMEQ